MAISTEELDSRIKHLDVKIAETKKRLPAHSIKPPVMMDLLELEDERDQLLRQRARLPGS